MKFALEGTWENDGDVWSSAVSGNLDDKEKMSATCTGSITEGK